MADQSYTKKSEPTHVYKCVTEGCTKKAKTGDEFRTCRSCRDKLNTEMVKSLNQIRLDKNELEAKKVEQKRYEDQIAILQAKLNLVQNEVSGLEKKIDLEKQKISYEDELVSDGHKLFEGIDYIGTKWTLETHCTIVRVKDSPENVYFGHVTLKIYNQYGREYTWHHGALVLGDIPKNLNHTYWFFENKQFPPEATTVSSFASFKGIEDDKLLSEIMKEHINRCAKFFKTKHQWENQVWYPDDVIGTDKEKATEVVERIIKIKKARETTPNTSSSRLEKDLDEQRQQIINLEREAAYSREREALAEIVRLEEANLEKQAKAGENTAKELQIQDQKVLEERQKWIEEIRKRTLADAEQANLIAQKTKKQNELAAAAELAAKRAAAELVAAETKRKEDLKNEKAIQALIKKQALEQKTLAQTETEKELEKILQEKRQTSKEKVEKFLQKIEDNEDIKSMKINLDIAETEDDKSEDSFKYRDSLIKEYNKLILYINDNMNVIEKEVGIYLNEKEKKATLRSIQNIKETLFKSKNEVYKRNILRDIERWQLLYTDSTRKKEKNLLKNILQNGYNYYYLHNLDDINGLIEFYTRYKPKLKEWSSLDLDGLSLKDSKQIRSAISILNTMVNPELHLEKLYTLRELKNTIDFYMENISPKEDKLLNIEHRQQKDAIGDITYLIKFYRNVYIPKSENWSRLDFSGLSQKDSDTIKADILALNTRVNPERRLEYLEILLELNKLAVNYNENIRPKEDKLLKNLYRQETEANTHIIYLIKFYSDYLLKSEKWSLVLSKLSMEDASMKDTSMIIHDIAALNTLVNPKERLEKLYIMQSFNQKQSFAKVDGDFDEEERQDFLKKDVTNLENILNQRKFNMETELLGNIHPMSDTAKKLRIDLNNIYFDYMEYTNNLIDEIQFTLNDDDPDKIKILEHLKAIETQIDMYISELDDNHSAYKHLDEMKKYYYTFIQPEMRKGKEKDVNSLIAYYETFEFNLNFLVMDRLENLKPEYMATKLIRDSIESFFIEVNPKENLELLLPLKKEEKEELSIKEDKKPSFDGLDSIITYYNDFDDNKSEKVSTIIRNFMIILSGTGTYDEAKNFVKHVKDFRSKMYKEKFFSSKSVLKYYTYLK